MTRTQKFKCVIFGSCAFASHEVVRHITLRLLGNFQHCTSASMAEGAETAAQLLVAPDGIVTAWWLGRPEVQPARTAAAASSETAAATADAGEGNSRAELLSAAEPGCFR